MKNFNVITMPGGEQHVTYIGPPLTYGSPRQTIRVDGIVTADKVIALGMAAEIVYRQTGRRARLVVPYFPGARQDRIDDSPNVGFSLHVYAHILGAFDWDELVILDPHSTATPVNIIHGYRQQAPRRLTVLGHEDWFLPWLAARNFKPAKNRFLFPDAGAENKYSLVGAYSPSRSCRKQRDPATGKLSGFEVPSLADWEGHHVWIVDDICDGGGTFIEIARQVRAEMGDSIQLGLAVSHGIFSKGLSPLVPWFNHILTTDSVTDPKRYPEVSVQMLAPIIQKTGK